MELALDAPLRLGAQYTHAAVRHARPDLLVGGGHTTVRPMFTPTSHDNALGVVDSPAAFAARHGLAAPAVRAGAGLTTRSPAALS